MMMMMTIIMIREWMIDHLQIKSMVLHKEMMLMFMIIIIVVFIIIIMTIIILIIIREWMIDHLEIESTVLHKESEEGKAQMQREGANKMGKNGLC